MRAVPKDELHAWVGVHGMREVERAVSWTDRNGENLAIFSHRGNMRHGGSSASEYLDVQHLVLTNAQRPKILRRVKEDADPCEADPLLSFRDEALTVTDLDNDGFGELTFAYVRGCRTATAPAALKLLMLENGDKYILRGTMRSERGERGDFRVDPSFCNRSRSLT